MIGRAAVEIFLEEGRQVSISEFIIPLLLVLYGISMFAIGFVAGRIWERVERMAAEERHNAELVQLADVRVLAGRK